MKTSSKRFEGGCCRIAFPRQPPRFFLARSQPSSLPAPCRRPAFEPDPRPTLQLGVIQRHTSTATSQDQHSRRNQLISDLADRISQPRPISPRPLSQAALVPQAYGPRQVSSPCSTLAVSVARSTTITVCARKRCPIASLVRMSVSVNLSTCPLSTNEFTPWPSKPSLVVIVW